MGVDSWPVLTATDDTNEMTSPITPFVRTIDAFNPSDKALRIVSSGGVTTALVLPGSGYLMGGEAFAFKLHPSPFSIFFINVSLYQHIFITESVWWSR